MRTPLKALLAGVAMVVAGASGAVVAQQVLPVQPDNEPEAGASGAHERQQVGGSSHPKAGSGRPRQKGTVPQRIAPPEANRGPHSAGEKTVRARKETGSLRSEPVVWYPGRDSNPCYQNENLGS